MSAKNLVRKVVVVAVLVCISAGLARADKLQLHQKLSKDIRIELSDVSIAEALAKIGQKAEVKFVLSDEAAWKLPNGEATRLSVALVGPLAESMTEMLNAFFMRYAVGDEKITIYPRPELQHILGKPTAKQIELLTDIYKIPTKVTQGINSEAITHRILGQEVLILPVSRCDDLDEFLQRLTERLSEGDTSPPFTLAQMLDSVGGAWYISGMDFPNQMPEIRLISSTKFLEAKLDQIVDISFKDETSDVILRRLAQWTGMEFIVDAKDLWLFSEERISVNMQNISLRQAIRNIAVTVGGYAGINIGDNEVVIEGPIHEKKTTPKVAVPAFPGASPLSIKAVGGSYVGKISIPMDGGKYFIEFMLRESDLTEELKKLRAEKMKEILGQPAKKAEEAQDSK